MLKELAFDYDHSSVQKVLQKLRKALAAIPEQTLEPSLLGDMLAVFQLTSEVYFSLALIRQTPHIRL